jgi:ABC-type transporter Mla subunit MlaD
MSTRSRAAVRRRQQPARPNRSEIAQVVLLVLAIVAVWYLAWGRYRHQPPPQVQYHFRTAETGRAQP